MLKKSAMLAMFMGSLLLSQGVMACEHSVEQCKEQSCDEHQSVGLADDAADNLEHADD